MVMFHSFLYVYQRVNMMILPSMDWFKGTFTGKHHIWWEIPWFPVDFPLNQSIDTYENSWLSTSLPREAKDAFLGLLGCPTAETDVLAEEKRGVSHHRKVRFFFTTNRVFKQELRLHMILQTKFCLFDNSQLWFWHMLFYPKNHWGFTTKPDALG